MIDTSIDSSWAPAQCVRGQACLYFYLLGEFEGEVVSIKEQFTETLLTESGREPKVGNGRSLAGEQSLWVAGVLCHQP